MLMKFWKIFYLRQEVEMIYQSKYMMSFNDFVQKYKLKNKATSNIKIYQVLSSLSMNDVGICLRDGPFKNDIGLLIYIPQKEHIGLYT